MANVFLDFFNRVKTVFWNDKLNRGLLIAAFSISLIVLWIWRRFLTGGEVFVYTGFNIYPVQYLAIILMVNTILSYFSFEKEKEISRLLLSTNIFICFLLFCLEVFYLAHR